MTEQENYLNASYGLKSWLLTKDHKRIALLYLITITLFFFIGGVFATLIRVELLSPQGNLVSSDTYNKLFTMHGMVMIFFFLIPSIPATLGNFFLPMMIGARDLAFPQDQPAELVPAGDRRRCFAIFAMVAGGVDTGWTFYTPYSTTYSNTWVIATALGIFVAGFSSILTGLNFIVTVHRMRAPGMTWFRMPLFVWAHYATAVIQVLGTPVLAVTLVLVFCERVFHIGHLRSRPGRRPGAVPAPVLVLLAPRRVHHGAAGHGRDQRAGLDLFAQADVRLQASSPFPAWPSRCSASWSGGITCSSAANRCMPAWSFRFSVSSWPSPRPSKSSTGRRRCTKAPSRMPRRCSMRSVSSACSPSAG